MDNVMIVGLIAGTLRTATPLILAGLGGVFSERAGVVNIGLEGMMIMGAFFSVFGTYISGSPVVGIIFAVVAGMAISLIHAFLSINLKAEQVISGTAINLFSSALASFLIFKIFKKGGQTDIVPALPYHIPAAVKSIPILGPILSGINWFVIIAIVLVFVANYIIFKTPLGLRIRSVGEHPKAADTLGINVYAMRYLCVIISGALAGLGGAALVGITPVYREGMVAGRGFIALAAMIFGNWKPFGTMWACLLFAFGGSFQIFAQGFSWHLPSEFYSSIPYILTMLALAGFVGKTIPPAADGEPYEKGQR
ncbi:ABC transporter permease [Clostridium sp. DJ247]|uniref:ABC transporter permease n=1 Tax=Clostridium sp. DJ247 TaxID=2726188 RepID=UPI001628EB1D|nr:ABC transporter permease [Clostridium sp. DJ247]MBC2582066.1 ABC transporter permease [Clostridium sp. DJ247]